MNKVSTSWLGLPEHVQHPDPYLYRSNNYVVLDFETTNEDFGDAGNPENSIVCACWRTGKDHPRGRRSHAIRGTEFDMQELVRDIEQADFLIAHNAKFELKWLRRCGLELTSVVVWCSQIAEYVLAGNRKWALSLAECAKRRNLGSKDFVGRLIRQGVKTEDIPYEWVEDYCNIDVDLHEKLFFSQREDIYKRDLQAVTYTRMLLTPVLADIEFNGMCLDPERVNPLYYDYQERYNKVEAELNEITGGINFKSNDQVAEYIYDKLGFKELTDDKGRPKRNQKSYDNAIAAWEKRGKCDAKGNPCKKPCKGRKTDKNTLPLVFAQGATTPEQQRFLDIRSEAMKLSHALSNALGKFHQCINETEDNILYADFNQTQTSTHRLSSSGKRYAAQFQNFNKKFKPVFTTRNLGWLFAEHDQAQLEFRVAVDGGRDEVGMEDIQNKVDVHAATASVIFHQEWPKVRDDLTSSVRETLRFRSKEHTFKPLYGGEFGTDDEMRYYKYFRERYTGISNLQEEWKQHVINYRHIRCRSGLIFYWPHAKINKWGKLAPRIIHQICNYNVQSFATADIVPISLVYMWHRLKKLALESFIVSTVHDSVLGEVKPEEKDVYDKVASISFEKDTVKYLKKVYRETFNVPLLAEADFGTHWHTSDEWVKTNIGEQDDTRKAG